MHAHTAQVNSLCSVRACVRACYVLVKGRLFQVIDTEFLWQCLTRTARLHSMQEHTHTHTHNTLSICTANSRTNGEKEKGKARMNTDSMPRPGSQEQQPVSSHLSHGR